MAEDTKATQPRAAQEDEKPGRTPSDAQVADVGTPTPQSLRQLAEDLPAGDKVQKAYKDAMLADTAQQEVRAKVVAVNESPNAGDTPSGSALKKVSGVANDSERGEKYLLEKTAVRWGYVPVD